MQNLENQEIEVKLHIANLDRIRSKIHSIQGELIRKRVLERNYRFDDIQKKLTKSFKVLRLRQDTAAYLTFKGPMTDEEGVKIRHEVEFKVDDFDAAYEFLLALGYKVFMIYEKYREVYKKDNTEICVDELPYGNFIEIEGRDPKSIHFLCDQLELDWNLRIPESYSSIFERLKKQKGLKIRDLTFDNFKDRTIELSDLGIYSAD